MADRRWPVCSDEIQDIFLCYTSTGAGPCYLRQVNALFSRQLSNGRGVVIRAFLRGLRRAHDYATDSVDHARSDWRLIVQVAKERPDRNRVTLLHKNVAQHPRCGRRDLERYLFGLN